jgi:hypothetical protein
LTYLAPGVSDVGCVNAYVDFDAFGRRAPRVVNLIANASYRRLCLFSASLCPIADIAKRALSLAGAPFCVAQTAVKAAIPYDNIDKER